MNRRSVHLLHWTTLLALCIASGCGFAERGDASLESGPTANPVNPEPVKEPIDDTRPLNDMEAIIALREKLDATLYADEVAAQRHEEFIIAMWDDLRNRDPFEVLQAIPFTTLKLGTTPQTEVSDWGAGDFQTIQFTDIRSFSRDEARELLNQLAADGWDIAQTEWHHSTFEPGAEQRPARSVVAFEVHAARGDAQRAIVRGDLKITWQVGENPDEPPRVETIDAEEVVVIMQEGIAMFEPPRILDPKTVARGRFPRVSPLIVADLNDDGRAEIIMAGCNVLYWNRGPGEFESDVFLKDGPRQMAEAGILADFTGDGVPDFVTAAQGDTRLLLFPGERNSNFTKPPQVCFRDEAIENPHAMTAGDIDGDGDLDLFVGQYRAPYEDGKLPTPYYDANDGPPDYLLQNDGSGIFTDISNSAGLTAKVHRRTYSASLVDLDDDDDLDLLVVSDFSGLDLYRNDGDGKLTDVTNEWTDERHAFGMSHTLNDFNGDGALDLYMIGMSSTTARRLERLGLRRPGYEDLDQARMQMAYGNRMYISAKQKFVAPSFADQVARSGWSWGCTSQDFDNDGDTDIYIANGHISGRSAKDYCTRFWCHDVYDGQTHAPEAMKPLLDTTLMSGLGKDFSWNGFEHNVLLLNKSNAQGFTSAGFLLGAAYEFDSRAVVANDLDRDGRVDLLVVQYDTQAFQQRLAVVHNVLPKSGNWIGVDLAGAPGVSPIGAKVTVHFGDSEVTKYCVTGDSFTAQHSQTLHFGLGSNESVERIVVRWPNGQSSTLPSPDINQYQRIAPMEK